MQERLLRIPVRHRIPLAQPQNTAYIPKECYENSHSVSDLRQCHQHQGPTWVTTLVIQTPRKPNRELPPSLQASHRGRLNRRNRGLSQRPPFLATEHKHGNKRKDAGLKLDVAGGGGGGQGQPDCH
jgi:hypothetical protein